MFKSAPDFIEKFCSPTSFYNMFLKNEFVEVSEVLRAFEISKVLKHC